MHMHIHTHTYTHTHIHTYLHAYIHMFIHTYIHTYVHTNWWGLPLTESHFVQWVTLHNIYIHRPREMWSRGSLIFYAYICCVPGVLQSEHGWSVILSKAKYPPPSAPASPNASVMSATNVSVRLLRIITCCKSISTTSLSHLGVSKPSGESVRLDQMVPSPSMVICISTRLVT